LSLGIIEINDTGIQVAVDNKIITTSPGFAVMDGEHLMVGTEALENARLLPRWTNNRFWNQLSTDPISNSTDVIRHHADLALAHLESLWLPLKTDVESVILLAPAFYTQSQLGLLLGIARECGIPVSGVADSSLMAASDQPLQPLALHLDIHLHRITLTNLSSGSTLNRKIATTVTETGIFTLWDRWANMIADQFIQTSRFDPMHQAISEQALFNQLPHWIEQLGDSRGKTFELNLSGVNHTVSVSADQLMSACAQVYPQIVQFIRSQVTANDPVTLLLSHRFAGFPGLKDSLGLISNLDIIELSPGQSVTSATAHAESIIPKDSAITHIINLPISNQSEKVHTASGLTATHLLTGNHAIAIGKAFQLAKDLSDGIKQDTNNPVCTFYYRGSELYVDIHDDDILKINGKTPTSPCVLKAGDTLDIDQHSLTLISVA
jgi:hypothetical protein